MGEPRCAACHISVRGRTFRIKDELVYHDGCVNLPAILQTTLEAANADLTRERTARAQAVADRKQIRGDVEAKLTSITSELTTLRLAHTANQAAIATKDAELAAARSRIAALEAELAARPAPAREIPENDTRDASSIRFELLELK